MSYLTCSGILMLKLAIPRDLPCLSLPAQSDWALRPHAAWECIARNAPPSRAVAMNSSTEGLRNSFTFTYSELCDFHHF
jgi:hypothetical protein